MIRSVTRNDWSNPMRLQKTTLTEKYIGEDRPSVWLDVSCNDPATGLFDRTCRALSLTVGPAQVFGLDFSGAGRFPVFDIGTGYVRFLRHDWHFYGCREYVGNWAWNSYLMRPTALAVLLAAVRRSRRFAADAACAEGDCARLASWLDGDGPDRIDDIAAILIGHLAHCRARALARDRVEDPA